MLNSKTCFIIHWIKYIFQCGGQKYTSLGSFSLFSLCVTTMYVCATCMHYRHFYQYGMTLQSNPLVPWLLSRLLYHVAGSGVCIIETTHTMFPLNRYKSNSRHWQEYTEATAQSWGTTARLWSWAGYERWQRFISVFGAH